MKHIAQYLAYVVKTLIIPFKIKKNSPVCLSSINYSTFFICIMVRIYSTSPQFAMKAEENISSRHLLFISFLNIIFFIRVPIFLCLIDDDNVK